MNPPQTKCWRALRRCLVGLGVCVTLTGIFYTEELWRGKRAWNNCKREWQAQGIDLNWAHYIPAPVPDEENVFGVPEMQKWFVGRGQTELSKELSDVEKKTATAEFLSWSDQFEPEFAIIRQALQRPSMRMGGNYADPYDIPIPNFVTVRALVQTLKARAHAHFLLGQREDALRDLTLLHDSCRIMTDSKPMTLVGAMINVAVAGLYTDVVADGIKTQCWREPQLAALEEQLKQINLLSPVKQAFEMERVAVCQTLATAPPARMLEMLLDQPGRKLSKWQSLQNSVLTGLFPHGWIYQNLATGVDLHPDAITGLDRASQIISPGKYKAYRQKFDALSSHWSPYTFMAIRTTPNYDKAVQTTARNQTMVNEALIACALERYHLGHGNYPETLDALAPKFLDIIPHDVIGGEPLHYHRAADGTFLLYSIGWNGQDDGGVRGKTITDGDWVWPVDL